MVLANERRRYLCNVFSHWLRPCWDIEYGSCTVMCQFDTGFGGKKYFDTIIFLTGRTRCSNPCQNWNCLPFILPGASFTWINNHNHCFLYDIIIYPCLIFVLKLWHQWVIISHSFMEMWLFILAQPVDKRGPWCDFISIYSSEVYEMLDCWGLCFNMNSDFMGLFFLNGDEILHPCLIMWPLDELSHVF